MKTSLIDGKKPPHFDTHIIGNILLDVAPLDEVQQQVHQQAVSSGRYHSMPDLWHPAESLIWPWDMRRTHSSSLVAPPPSAQALSP